MKEYYASYCEFNLGHESDSKGFADIRFTCEIGELTVNELVVIAKESNLPHFFETPPIAAEEIPKSFWTSKICADFILFREIKKREIIEMIQIEREKERYDDEVDHFDEEYSSWDFARTANIIRSLRDSAFVQGVDFGATEANEPQQENEPDQGALRIHGEDRKAGGTPLQQRNRFYYEKHQNSDMTLPEIARAAVEEFGMKEPDSVRNVQTGARQHHKEHCPDVPFKKRPKGRRKGR